MKRLPLLLIKQDKFLLNKGQSILEILLALIVFLIAFITLVVLVNNYLKSLKLANERIIANFLAHQGIELVYAKRNLNAIETKDWLDGFSISNTFCIDYDLSIISTNDPCRLYINQDGLYTITSSSTPTPFSILLEYTTIATDAIMVTSTVYFNNQPLVQFNSIMTKWANLLLQ